MTQRDAIAEFSPAEQRPGWPVIGMSLVAMAALYFSSGGYLGLVVLALALMASRFFAWRIPRRRLYEWLARGAIFSLLLLAAGELEPVRISIAFDPPYAYRFGYLCAGEIVLRAWLRRQHGHNTGEYVLLSALVMTTASNTYERLFLHWLAPVYALLLVLSLRSASAPVDRPRRRAGLVALRALAVALAVGIGYCSVYAVTEYDNQISYWAVHLLRQRKSSGADQVGLSTAPRLGAVFNPAPSMQRVLRIDGKPSERYLRAMAFDTYENRAWRPALAERNFDLAPADRPVDGERLRFTRLFDTFDLLLLPLESRDIETTGGVARDALGTLRQGEGGSDEYALTLPRQPGAQGMPAVAMDDAARARAMAVPAEVDPAVVALARRVAGDAAPLERVIRLSNYLRSTCTYSLNVDPGQGDPISSFILKTHAGHCQYFASALVVMARAAGVPARYVTGFYAHERLGQEAMVVRQRDAHAWVECWIDGTGWMTFDATPAGGRPDQLFPPASRWRTAGEWLKDLPRRLRRWMDRLDRWTMLEAIGLLSAIVVLVLAAREIWSRSRRRRAAWSRYGGDPELAQLARRFERALARARMPLTPQHTWREHLAARGDHPGAGVALEFVDGYDQRRFGPATGETVPALKARLERLEQRLLRSEETHGRG